MRHFLGLLLGIVVTGAILAGAGWASQDAVRGVLSTAGGGANAIDPVEDPKALIGLGVMLAVGLLLGLVVAGRVSPLATFVPSIVLLAWTVIYALDVNRALGLAPTDTSMNQIIVQAGKGMQSLLGSGVFALLGLALFIPVLMPSRWAGRPGKDDGDFEEQSPEPTGYY